MRIEVIMELMKLDLPEPVAPATSRWGILAKLATTNPLGGVQIRDLVGRRVLADLKLVYRTPRGAWSEARQCEVTRTDFVTYTTTGLVDQCATADRSDYTSSVIVDYTGNPYTVRYLSQIFGVSTIISGADPSSLVDVKVILGQDWQVPAN